MLIIPEQITKGKQVFKYTSYWGKWSRMIAFGPDPGWYLELDLTPIPNPIEDWDKIASLNLRYHCTVPDIKEYWPEKEIFTGDRFTCELPSNVFDRMFKNIEIDIINYMLTEDFYPQIDLDLLKKNSNGGCSLVKCLKV